MATKWHELEIKDVFKETNSSEKGISSSDATARISKFGKNVLTNEHKISRLAIFMSQFKDTLVIILIAATIFSAIIGEFVDATAIVIIVILNSIFGFFQEYRAEKTIEALKKLTTPEAIVLRDGKKTKIPSSMIVPGDMVFLEQGSRVPADMRITDANELKVDESIITGESVPVNKAPGISKGNILCERKNMLYMGTVVTYGRCTGIVVGTGMETEIGRIAHLVQETVDEDTPLQKKLEKFGKSLGFLILGICATVVVLGLLREGPLSGMPITTELMVTMIITGIALAVAAIPEGLPAIVTITLALGLQKLSKNNALMRRLPAVETLGSTTVICSDKTGTLTKNEMMVSRAWTTGGHITVSGSGYEPSGEFTSGKSKIVASKDSGLSILLKAGALCNNAQLSKSESGWSIIGDPTEGSLMVLAEKAGISVEGIEKSEPRQKEISFSSERKMMSTIHKSGKGIMLYSKGAPETILDRCSKIFDKGKERKITSSDKKTILDANHDMTSGALRVLGVAYRKAASFTGDPEKDMVFVGLVGMIDPPREEVFGDIQLCKKAGIKVVMITGDHQNTAVAIAKQLKIIEDGGRFMTGNDIDAMPEKEFYGIVNDISVYARVNPEHKVKIVDALKKSGHIIAMTGDGVNDAPALKKADIGISMGIKGTDVAKEASDMILSDDNFSSIVKAVKEGRGIYDNIKKFVQYLLSSNLGEVLIVFMAILIGFTDPATGMVILPVTAIQLLWINILTDGLPALALGVDPPTPNIMDRKPRDPKENILSRQMLMDVVFVGVLMCIGTLYLFAINLQQSAAEAVTIAFTTIVVFEMVRVQAVRMKFKIGLFSNKKLLIAMAISLGLQVMVVYVPFFNPIFDTIALNPMDWFEIIGVCAILMVLMIIWQKKTKDL